MIRKGCLAKIHAVVVAKADMTTRSSRGCTCMSAEHRISAAALGDPNFVKKVGIQVSGKPSRPRKRSLVLKYNFITSMPKARQRLRRIRATKFKSILRALKKSAKTGSREVSFLLQESRSQWLSQATVDFIHSKAQSEMRAPMMPLTRLETRCQ